MAKNIIIAVLAVLVIVLGVLYFTSPKPLGANTDEYNIKNFLNTVTFSGTTAFTGATTFTGAETHSTATSTRAGNEVYAYGNGPVFRAGGICVMLTISTSTLLYTTSTVVCP